MISFIYGRGIQWYDLFFIALAFVLAFPDRTLEWTYQKWNLAYTRRHVFALAVGVSILMAGFALFLLSIEARRFFWWRPIGFVGLFACFRIIRALVCDVLGLRDD